MIVPRRWGGGHTSRIADPQFELVGRTAPRAGARYPLDTNLAVYLGPASFMVELET